MHTVFKQSSMRVAFLVAGALMALLVAFALAVVSPTPALAKTKYVKVSVLVKQVSKATYTNRYGEYYAETSYKYNKNGLISHKSSLNHGGGAAGGADQTLKYTKKGLISKVVEADGVSASVFTRDKKGRVTKTVSFTGQATNTYKYNKAGKIAKATMAFKNFEGKVTSKSVSTVAYNKKGLISKITTKGGWEEGVRTYTYDSRGMLKSETVKGKSKTTYKNTYKNGKLVKRVGTTVMSDGEKRTETTTYKYKTVKVPQSKAERAKDQQKALFLVKIPQSEDELHL